MLTVNEALKIAGLPEKKLDESTVVDAKTDATPAEVQKASALNEALKAAGLPLR